MCDELTTFMYKGFKNGDVAQQVVLLSIKYFTNVACLTIIIMDMFLSVIRNQIELCLGTPRCSPPPKLTKLALTNKTGEALVISIKLNLDQ